ncbi:tRNA-intron lyase [Methanopyrus kandleri]|uniref:tRNA-splicing endonuclease n=1 Tax=Methanopyrus kandleri TaxID=2320 RepID=A0A832WRU5_9EURY|nr:tRNA-intron lyase [Methanopyrus kandleri]HII70506.1 tRNA-intron lyase [Methanopyrus kandleri]
MPRAKVFEGGSLVSKDYEDLKRRYFGTEHGNVLFLDPFETVYLTEKGEIDPETPEGEPMSVEELLSFFERRRPGFRAGYVVYRDLTERGYVVKSGFKYGGRFRVYEEDPDREHSKYVVRVVEPDTELSTRDVLRATRLAHSVRKDFVLAVVEDVEEPRIEYVMWRWKRL